MKLSKSQIEQLYSFTQKHYVDWYDVQTELVDHLANGIERHLEQNPNTTFDSALNNEFKKFGVMGFGEVIEEKTKALNTYYRKQVWTYFKDFVKLPKIIITLFLIWVLYLSLMNVSDRFWVVIPVVTALTILPIWFLVKQSRNIKNLKRSTGKKWLFDSISMQLGGMVYTVNIFIQVLLFPSGTWSSIMNFMFSVIIVLFGLAIYISIFVVSPKLKKDMALLHPDYKFV